MLSPNHGNQLPNDHLGNSGRDLCPLPGTGVNWASEYRPAPLPLPLLGFLRGWEGPQPQDPVCTQAPLNPTPVVWGCPSPSQQLFSLPSSYG